MRVLPVIAAVLLLFDLPAGARQAAAPAYRERVLAVQRRIEAQDFAGARALLREATASYPADGGLENLLGVLDVQQGDREGARRAFREAVVHSPKLVGAYLNLGRLLLESPQPTPAEQAEALRLYQHALQLQPGNPEASVQAGLLLMLEGQYVRSRAVLAALDPETQRSVRVQVLLCADDAASGEANAAQREAEGSIADPGLEEEDVLGVLPALRAGHRADLLDRMLGAVAERRPLSAAGLRVWGLAREAEGKREEAKATLERAYAADGGSAAVLMDLARIALADKRYEDALGYLAHARALAPKDPSLAYEFGVVCFKMNLLGESRKAMEEALRLAPDSPEMLLGMGTVSSLSQDPLQGLPYLMRYHRAKPGDPEGLLLIGATYFRAKDFEAAKPWLRQAAVVPGTAAAAHLYLGSSLRQQGQNAEAMQELEAAGRLGPEQAEVHAEKGQVYLQEKQYTEAERELARAVALDADSYAGNFGLLQLYARTGDSRREEQARRFEAVKDHGEQRSREAMRVIETHPETAFVSSR